MPPPLVSASALTGLLHACLMLQLVVACTLSYCTVRSSLLRHSAPFSFCCCCALRTFYGRRVRIVVACTLSYCTVRSSLLRHSAPFSFCCCCALRTFYGRRVRIWIEAELKFRLTGKASTWPVTGPGLWIRVQKLPDPRECALCNGALQRRLRLPVSQRHDSTICNHGDCSFPGVRWAFHKGPRGDDYLACYPGWAHASCFCL